MPSFYDEDLVNKFLEETKDEKFETFTSTSDLY